MNTWLRPVFILGSLALTVGCGGPTEPKLAEVKGTVTYKGKPLPGGTVAFMGADGYRGVGPIMRNGTYSLKCPYGQVKVAVVTRSPTAESMKDGQRPAVREVHMPAGVDPRSLPPQKYERFDSSGLSFEVKENGQTIDLPLD